MTGRAQTAERNRGRVLATLALLVGLASLFAWVQQAKLGQTPSEAAPGPAPREDVSAAMPASDLSPESSVPAIGAGQPQKPSDADPSACPPAALEQWLRRNFTQFPVALPGFREPRVRPLQFVLVADQLHWLNADSFPPRAETFARARLGKLSTAGVWAFTNLPETEFDSESDSGIEAGEHRVPPADACRFKIDWQLVPDGSN